MEFRTIGNATQPRRWFQPVEKLGDLPVPNPGNRNLYFSVLPGTRKGGKAQDVAIGPCLGIDLDGPPAQHWEYPAAAIVETSPGNKQAYWVLEEPREDLDHLEDLNRRLAHFYGADPVAHDRARVLRVPGFSNFKYPDAPLSRIVQLDPKLAYPAELLGEALPTEKRRPEKPVQPFFRGR